jgi:hypothetical protein
MIVTGECSIPCKAGVADGERSLDILDGATEAVLLAGSPIGKELAARHANSTAVPHGAPAAQVQCGWHARARPGADTPAAHRADGAASLFGQAKAEVLRVGAADGGSVRLAGKGEKPSRHRDERHRAAPE